MPSPSSSYKLVLEPIHSLDVVMYDFAKKHTTMAASSTSAAGAANVAVAKSRFVNKLVDGNRALDVPKARVRITRV